ncbi:MAG TPA: hypothetical protein DCM86_09920 [Verrucomicrobiales bacterium]|nr:hypothetical protein [Verrucomicrobiales bacterium]
MRVLIAGCGYVGLPLGARLAGLGHEVWGLRRSGADDDLLRSSGLRPLTADVTERGSFPDPGPGWDWVVFALSSRGGGIEGYERLYVQGTRNVLSWLEATPPRRVLQISSTSVYGQADGSVVTEESPADPSNGTSRLLLASERLLLEFGSRHNVGALILRAAGIYGPGRGHLFLQYLNNEATLTGEGDRWLNMIHREDLVTAIIAALERGRPAGIYNVADTSPVTEVEFFRWLSVTLGKPMPPTLDPALRVRKRGATNKRVSAQKLATELGVSLRYPSFREGYAAEIASLQLRT